MKEQFFKFFLNTQNISGPITFTLSSRYANIQGRTDEKGWSLGTNQEIDAASEHFAEETHSFPQFVKTGTKLLTLEPNISGALCQAQC